MRKTAKSSDTDYKEMNVSDFFKTKFSYYNALIERPRKETAIQAKNSLFSALVAKDGADSDELEEVKLPRKTTYEVNQDEEDSRTVKEEASDEFGDLESSSNRVTDKEKQYNK